MTTEDRHPSADYLEALYEIEEERLPQVQAELSRWMGASRASVSEHVKRLVSDDLVTVDGRVLGFTRRGRSMAITLVRRHRLAEHLLIDVIGLPWHLAHDEALRWERVISDLIEERLVKLLGDPGACPHGNPIPGSANEVDPSGLQQLTRLASGKRAILRRLTEDLELELPVMKFLEESGLMPGARLRVDGIGPDGSMSVVVGDRTVALGPDLADNLWVDTA